MSDLPSHSGLFKPFDLSITNMHTVYYISLLCFHKCGSIQVVQGCIGLDVLAYLPTAVGDRAESTRGVEEGQHAKIH